MTYTSAKGVTSNGKGGGDLKKKIYYMYKPLTLKSTSRKKTIQYPLHYVTYVPILRLLRTAA